jgi:predicted transposase YbfD/YdcC
VIVRKIFVNTADADFVREAWNVPNCRTLLCTVREVWKDGERQSCEKRYFVSSLDASVVSPERFLELVQGHWQIENRLHLIKDRWWDDDRHVLFRPGLGEIWSALTDLALSLLRSLGEKGKTMPRKAMQVAQQPLTYLQMLGY